MVGDNMTEDYNLDDIFGGGDINYDMLDRTDAQYRKAQVENEYARNERTRKENDPLTKALSEAIHLTDERKEKFLNLASLYLDNMQENIFKNQFQLAEDYYDYTADEWNDFLTDKIVNVYVSKHKRTLLKAAAEDNLANPLAKNKRDNLKLIENIKAEEQSESNKNIVIMRIPDIYDE